MEQLIPVIMEYANKYPALATVLLVMSIFRVIFKPVFSVAEAYVAATPSPKDDEDLKTFKDGKLYKALAWFVDYTTSIKIPVTKTQVAEAPADKVNG